MQSDIYDRIEKWMQESIEQASWEAFHDLHVDDIDESWTNASQWVRASGLALATAVQVRDNHKFPFVVALGMSLRSAARPVGFSLRSLDELTGLLDSSPPSLYVFQERWPNWMETQERGVPISDIDFGVKGVGAFYTEMFNVEDMDYRRCVWLFSSPKSVDSRAN